MPHGNSKVFNGESVSKILDYLDQHYERLERIEAAIRDQETSEAYLRKSGTVQLDGTGAGTVEVVDVPLGYDYLLQRMTLSAGGAGVGVVYLDATALSNAVEFATLAAGGGAFLYSDAFSNNAYAPGGSKVILGFIGAGANAIATYNMQIQVVKADSKTHTPHTMSIGDA